MIKKMLEILEFNKVLNMLEEHALSDKVRARIRNLEPFLSEAEVSIHLNETTEAKLIMEHSGNPPLSVMNDLDKSLSLIGKGTFLMPEQLVNIAQFLTACRRLKTYLKKAESISKTVASYGNSEIAVKWYERSDIPQLYNDTRFKNALFYDVNALRPDILAVTAVINGQIAAMAGASMDSELFWQIGIDVMPEYRNKGLATMLVSALTDEILNRNAVPYYGTWSANIGSRNVAADSGYFPAWVETSANKL